MLREEEIPVGWEGQESILQIFLPIPFLSSEAHALLVPHSPLNHFLAQLKLIIHNSREKGFFSTCFLDCTSIYCINMATFSMHPWKPQQFHIPVKLYASTSARFWLYFLPSPKMSLQVCHLNATLKGLDKI